MKKVVIVGGGVTGLTALYHLDKLKRERNMDIELTLIERDKELGGKIQTVKDHPFVMETGADSIVARNEGVLPFVEELELQEELVYNKTGTSYIYTYGKLHKIPQDTIFGIPMSVESLMESTLISEEGKRTALKDLDIPNTTFTEDSSIGEFLEAFFGKELVENQIAPVLSGVYSGNLYSLTMATTLPYLLEYKNQYGSIIKGLGENRHKFESASKGKFISFKNGLSALIDRMEDVIMEADILKGAELIDLKHLEDQYELTLADGEKIKSDYVVFSTSHDVTQKIISDPQLDFHFNQLKNSSLTSIYIGFNVKDDLLPADGTGFITSHGSDVLCDACTWTSRKWEHTSDDHELLVRLFYKSSNPHYEVLKELSEESFTKTALEDISKSLGIQASPVSVVVTDWQGLMPNYHLQHSDAVEALQKTIRENYPNVRLAGASYFGVGIGACIKNGKQTAEAIFQEITG
ncbi:protoporphyrinogen oxidase [Rossellomorea aquimaris]|uniref:Coproporphyrinogen III oxidase n=1 Tax=Rossellomorea aquimaris TaxID=189382 RepID=A0A1J6W1L3_9BACI|nr:protoporphyrinogen oxidase [Rossellomorea aquimaris]OIU72014.1 protoporphyrinogen oxidase [Rossellomorea aquimaris]